jgi:hypothetical protein
MNIFKKEEMRIDDFFMKSMDYSKKEGIVAFIIYVCIILLFFGSLYFISLMMFKIGVVYFILSIILILSLTEIDNKAINYIVIIYLLPYIYLLMGLDKVFIKFIPYRGVNPMMIRKYKLRTLKRKMIRNKLKFWK